MILTLFFINSSIVRDFVCDSGFRNLEINALAFFIAVRAF